MLDLAVLLVEDPDFRVGFQCGGPSLAQELHMLRPRLRRKLTAERGLTQNKY